MNIVCQNCAAPLELDDAAAAVPFDCPVCQAFNDPPRLRPDGTPIITIAPVVPSRSRVPGFGPAAQAAQRGPLGVLIGLVVVFVLVGAVLAARGEPSARVPRAVVAVPAATSFLHLDPPRPAGRGWRDEVPGGTPGTPRRRRVLPNPNRTVPPPLESPFPIPKSRR